MLNDAAIQCLRERVELVDGWLAVPCVEIFRWKLISKIKMFKQCGLPRLTKFQCLIRLNKHPNKSHISTHETNKTSSWGTWISSWSPRMTDDIWSVWSQPREKERYKTRQEIKPKDEKPPNSVTRDRPTAAVLRLLNEIKLKSNRRIGLPALSLLPSRVMLEVSSKTVRQE